MRLLSFLVLFLLLSCGISAQFKMTFRKSFIDSFRNRLTIQADYSIYHVGNVNSPADDGDIHFAGYDKKIGMSIVAEIMNARHQDEAVDLIRDHDGNGEPGEPISVIGVWRLWSEHISTGEHYFQGIPFDTEGGSGPHHIFEIHPATKIEDIDLLPSLKNIQGYSPKPGKTTFAHYDQIPATITQTSKTISIVTRRAFYNYTDFWIKLNSTEKYVVDDGLFVYCTVLDKGFRPGWNESSYLINKKTRVAFVKGSDPYNQAENLEAGEYLHVIGIPRISLNEIWRRARYANSQPAGLTKNMPYELIIVAIK